MNPYELVTRRGHPWPHRVRAVSLRTYHRHLWSYPEVRAAVARAFFSIGLRFVPVAGAVGTGCYGISKIVF